VPGHGDDRRLGGGDGVQRLELAAGQFEPAAEVGVRLRVDGGQRDVPVADANAVHRQAARLGDELDGVEQHPEHRGEETGGVGDRAGRGRDRVAEREVRRAGRRRHRPLAAYVARGPPARGRAKVAVHLRDGDPGEGGDLAVQGVAAGRAGVIGSTSRSPACDRTRTPVGCTSWPPTVTAAAPRICPATSAAYCRKACLDRAPGACPGTVESKVSTLDVTILPRWRAGGRRPCS